MPVLLVPVVVLAAIVFAVVALVRKSLTQQRERKALAAQHPNEPWMWRRDWADRAVRDTNLIAPGFLWFFGVFWLLLTTPVAYLVRSRVPQEPFLWFVLLFPAVGILVVCAATYVSLRRHKYGVSICHLEHLPVAIGKNMRGSIEARFTETPAEGVRFKLTNLRRIVRGSGKNRSVTERVLWQDEQVVRSGAMPHPSGLRIPFAFRIPAEGAEPADDRERDNRVLWRLEVAAEVPGIDYKTQFELPVFFTGEVDAWTPDVDPRGWQPSADSGITLGIAPTGEEIRVRPRQHLGDWAFAIVFFAIWFGVLAILTKFGAPIFFVAFFALISLLIVVMLGDLFIGRSRVILESQRIVARRTWLGLGPTRTVNAAEIESITPQVGLTSGSRVYHDVVIKLRNGKTVRAAKHIALRRDADMVAAKLRRTVGVTAAGTPAAARS